MIVDHQCRPLRGGTAGGFEIGTAGAARSAIRTLAGAFVLALVVPVPSHAFTLTKSTLSGGAVATAGTSYRLGATVGEAGAVGVTAGGGFRLIEGFWRPGLAVPSAVADPIDGPAPTEPGLALLRNEHGGNFPNPFGASTKLQFSVARPSPVAMTVYSAAGRRVRTLLRSDLPAGRHEIEWDGRDDLGRDLGAGVYFGRLEIGAWSDSRAILHIR
jgi:hypothetical protein